MMNELSSLAPLKIDVISPPYHGHLHPILGLATHLREFASVRVITTPDAASRAESLGFDTYPILADHVQDIWGIANAERPLRSNPFRLLEQFRKNLRMLPVLQEELDAAWTLRTPDIALVDFTLPSVGHWAQARGIHWWTSHPSALAMETPDGTPSYVGGWTPIPGVIGKVRDWAGRKAVRLFKQAVFALNRRELAALGHDSLYRKDGSEGVISDEVVLALTCPELEFQQTWPKSARLIGPVCYTPPSDRSSNLVLDETRANVLITIGTHLRFARESMAKQVERWAQELPGVFLHYTAGSHGDNPLAEGENWRVYPYINYDREIGRFDAVMHHGGAGVTFHTLRAGLPAVVWPQDYDQFDFAARLDYHGLAVRCSRAQQIPRAIAQALQDDNMRGRAQSMAHRLRQNDVRANLRQILEEQRLLPLRTTAA